MLISSVLDQNLLEIDVDGISETKVLKSVFGGKKSFTKLSKSPQDGQNAV